MHIETTPAQADDGNNAEVEAALAYEHYEDLKDGLTDDQAQQQQQAEEGMQAVDDDEWSKKEKEQKLYDELHPHTKKGSLTTPAAPELEQTSTGVPVTSTQGDPSTTVGQVTTLPRVRTTRNRQTSAAATTKEHATQPIDTGDLREDPNELQCE